MADGVSYCGRWKRGLGVLLAALSLLGLRADSMRAGRLRVLYSNTVFASVNRNDALVALKVWIDSMGKSRGFTLETEVASFDLLEEAEKRIQEGTVDLLVLNSMEFLQNRQAAQLNAEFVPALDDYVLLARRDRGVKGLGDLRGKSVIFFKLGADWGRLWMEEMLAEKGLGTVEEFFGGSRETDNPSSAILPVFFGKSDAVVVMRRRFQTMAELNPQLEKQLLILTNSPSVPSAVTCVHQDFTVFRKELLESLAELHRDPKGQQLLMLFKIDKLERLRPADLDGARDLLRSKAAMNPVRLP